jgi:hypothetical protein
VQAGREIFPRRILANLPLRSDGSPTPTSAKSCQACPQCRQTMTFTRAGGAGGFGPRTVLFRLLPLRARRDPRAGQLAPRIAPPAIQEHGLDYGQGEQSAKLCNDIMATAQTAYRNGGSGQRARSQKGRSNSASANAANISPRPTQGSISSVWSCSMSSALKSGGPRTKPGAA